MKYTTLLLFSFLLFVSCEQKHFYNQYVSVDIQNWKSTDTLKYAITIDDTTARYNLSFSVRHTKDYEFSNLWLSIILESTEVKKNFRYEIPLFKKDGKPFGKTSGSLCTQTIPVQQEIQFDKKGKYTINIVQLMRKDPLDGISDIGVIIDKK